ncbi:MAG: hypothetical protein JWO14_1535 [Solirubrobacterales bacterium]|jgi:hypothetical protein|nr:hypothetical protein [Solirubrobacterales bacterium]
MSSMDSTARTSVPARRATVDLIATAHWDE